MKLKYTLSFPEPHTHYMEVEMHISEITAKQLLLKMAVWTPGSYLIREFQENIDKVECIKNNEIIRLEKQDKNTWIVNTQNTSSVVIKYRIYCFEYSVRTNFVDDTHALINGASTFLYIDGQEHLKSEIEIKQHKRWDNISTALPTIENNKWVRIANNLDELIDSPIEIGNHISYFFDAANVSHELAIYGQSNCIIEKFINDLKKIIETEVAIFGSHPCMHYVFIIHNTDNSYGGLEHAHSSVNHITRWSYNIENYQRTISLLAHEYFHLWNVKRIRPKAFIPFNYTTENYTELLWFFEGITSYYDDYICYRAGVTSKEKFYQIVANNINDVVNTSGADTQTLAEASYDTWLKYYRRNENSSNTQINYYTHGALIAMVFDFMIMQATKGEKCLDDVMRILYEEYLKHPNKGITHKDILAVFNSVSGLDFEPPFQQYIFTCSLPDIDLFLDLMGIELINTTEEDTVFLGLSTQWKEGKLMISKLDKQYGAYKGGLSVEDEIIAIDRFRINKEFSNIYAHKTVNDTIEVLVSRQGVIMSYTISLTEDKRKRFRLSERKNKDELQYILHKKWLE